MTDKRLDLRTHLPYRFAKLSLRISRATTERYIQNTEISAREWRALGMLGIKGPLTPSELSSLTGMDRATITRASSHLVKQGLLRRTPHGKDNRSLLLELTEEGQKRCDEIVPKTAKSGYLCAKLYTAGEFSLFIEFLDRMDTAVADGIFEQQD